MFFKRDSSGGSFKANVLALVTGTTIAQIIPMAISPLVTRLYSPDEFGLFALYMSIVSVINVSLTGRYELAVVLPKKDDDAISITSTAIIVACVFSGLIFIVICFFNEKLAAILGNVQFSNWLYAVPISALSIATSQTLNYWLIRKKAFTNLSISKVWQTGSTALSTLILGFMGVNTGLLIGYILGNIIVIIVGMRQVSITGFHVKELSKAKIVEDIKRHRDLPKFSALPAMMDSASLSLPVMIINHSFGGAVTGFFNLSRQVLGGPLSIISLAISQVLLERISERKRNQQPVLRELLTVLYRLIIIALIFLVVTILLAPDIFAFIFGEKWRDAGLYSQIMACSFALRFVVSPLSIVFTALDAIKLGSVWQILSFFATCLLYFIGSTSVYSFLFVYLLIDILLYLIYLAMILKVVKSYDRGLLNE